MRERFVSGNGAVAHRAFVVGFALAALAASAAAFAQAYRWVDEKGRVQYSDQPPPGKVKPERVIKPPPAAPSAAAKDGKAGTARPLTPAEQEQAFRGRQAEAEKARKEEEAKLAEAKAREQGCLRAKLELAHLESGVRIQRMDARGELYYMEDDERERQIARLRDQVSSMCR